MKLQLNAYKELIVIIRIDRHLLYWLRYAVKAILYSGYYLATMLLDILIGEISI
jgi:hypothetical protein